MYKLIMNSIPFLVVVFLCKIFVSQTIVWDENSLSRPVITRNHRRLKGFTFNTFPSASLVSCGLKCQRNPRCVSTNFRRVSSLDETEGVCELNKMSALQLSIQLIEGKEPEYDEEAVYTQFYDIKVRRMLCVQKRKKKKKTDVRGYSRCIKAGGFTCRFWQCEDTAKYSQLLKNGLFCVWKRFVLLFTSVDSFNSIYPTTNTL